MNKKIVFISLPMSGLALEYIRQNIAKAQKVYLSITGMDSDSVLFLNNFGCPSPIVPLYQIKEGQEQIWRLGKALELLSKCDEAFFWFGWRNARGCRIEHAVCETYGIPIVSIEGAYDIKHEINEEDMFK